MIILYAWIWNLKWITRQTIEKLSRLERLILIGWSGKTVYFDWLKCCYSSPEPEIKYWEFIVCKDWNRDRNSTVGTNAILIIWDHYFYYSIFFKGSENSIGLFYFIFFYLFIYLFIYFFCMFLSGSPIALKKGRN